MRRPRIVYAKSWRTEPRPHFIAMVRKEDYDELKKEYNKLVKESREKAKAKK